MHAAVRELLRTQSRDRPMRIRTVRMEDTVVVRTDAELWTDDTATMRRKLQPPS